MDSALEIISIGWTEAEQGEDWGDKRAKTWDQKQAEEEIHGAGRGRQRSKLSFPADLDAP